MQYSSIGNEQRKLNQTPLSELHVLILQKKAEMRGQQPGGPGVQVQIQSYAKVLICITRTFLLMSIHPWPVSWPFFLLSHTRIYWFLSASCAISRCFTNLISLSKVSVQISHVFHLYHFMFLWTDLWNVEFYLSSP